MRLETRSPEHRTPRMNARERWGLLLIDETPDRLVAFPLLTSRAAPARGVTVREYCTGGETMARAHLGALEAFRADGISLFADVGVLAESMGSTLHFPEDDVPVLDVPVLSEGADPSALRLPRPGRGRLAGIVRAAALCHEAVGDIVPVFGFVPGPFTTAAMLRGTEDFLADLVLNPEYAEAVLDRATRAAVPFFDALMVAGALPVLVDPLASGSVISDEMFSRVVLPRLRSQVDYLHRFDMDVTLHVCGDTGRALRALADTGADLLSLDKIDLSEAVSVVGDRCRLVGNVSPTSLLLGSPADVRAEVERAVEAGRGNPKGFVVSTGCELPVATPSGNIRAFVETVEEMGEYSCWK